MCVFIQPFDPMRIIALFVLHRAIMAVMATMIMPTKPADDKLAAASCTSGVNVGSAASSFVASAAGTIV